jgi:hypothetical protein
MTYRTAMFHALLASLLAFSACAQARSPTPAQKSAAAIGRLIEAQDCAGALDKLKDGIRQDYAEVVLLAGSMYDHGVCVQRDWDRAILFYSQAYQAGLKEAAERLAAGFAAPENGADVVGALWWARRGAMVSAPGTSPLGPCTVSPEATDDIDRFVAELKTWPQTRLAMCNYVVGVMSTLWSEMKYPGRARAYGVGGDVTLRFLPAVPRIEMKTARTAEYQPFSFVAYGDEQRIRASKRVTGGFAETLGALGDRALARYPRPAGIPDNTEFLLRFIFRLE